MKKKSLLTAIAIIVIFSLNASAQVTATAPTYATIVTPISILKNTDMNFGNVAVSSTAGTVILAPASNRTLTGGVTLPVTAGTVTAAQFTVSGQADYTYAITLPTADFTITNTDSVGAETMTVNAFSSTPDATGTLTSGTENILVGATLNVSASQVTGLYTSGTDFDVTVNYN
jgi:hypothetical protein